VWGIGGTYNVTAQRQDHWLQYYKAKDLSGNTGSLSNSDTGAKLYSLGYEHSLSKRTMLKAGYAYLKNDSKVSTNGNGGYDFGNNPASLNAGVAIGDDVKVSGFQFGMRHAF
jgi:predicted porin